MAGVPEGFKRINFNASDELAARLDAESARAGLSKASILTQALEAWLSRDAAPAWASDEDLPEPVVRDLETLQEGLRKSSMQRSLLRLQEIAAEAARRKQNELDTSTDHIPTTPVPEDEPIDPRLA